MEAYAYGILDASFAVGFVILGLIIAFIKKRLKEESLLSIGFLIMGIGMSILAFSDHFILSISSLFLIGASIALTGPSRKSLLMEHVDDSYIGRVESLNWMMFSSISPILALLASISSKYISLQGTLLTVTICILVVFMICRIAFMKNKKVQVFGTGN
jgi:MFS family permease